jgi:hypothetical protein
VTAWWNFASRLILREAYTHFQIPENDVVTIRFVVGLPEASDPGVLRILLWERDRFQDLQILNVTENMNNGKSYEYFADLASNFPSHDPTRRPWDYAMKLDDDSLVNIPRLLDRLRPMVPREELYMVSAYIMARLMKGTWGLLLAYGRWLYSLVGSGDLVGQ